MTLHPAEINFGVQFRCGGQLIRADWRNVEPSPLCTTLVGAGVSIATVEHLLAAFAGLELDNVLVELSGPEVPAMDGSAAPFVELVERAGLVEQRAPRRAIEVMRPVRVTDGDSSAALEPADEFSLSFAIDFASDAIRRSASPSCLRRRGSSAISAAARTFGFLHEVERMRAGGPGARWLARQRRCGER